MDIVENLRQLSCHPPLTRRVIDELGVTGLYCGCGGVYLRGGWVNTDIARLSDRRGNVSAKGKIVIANEDYYYLEHDATTTFPFENEVFNWVYSERFIEHISLQQAVFLVKRNKANSQAGRSD